MLTRSSRSLLALVLLCVVSACEEPAPVVDDQSWDAMSREQRYEHLRTKVDDSLETLRTTGDASQWHSAAAEAIRGLSLLRVEGGLDDREAYAELEAEVERLTDEPPFFVREQAGAVEGIGRIER